MTQRDDDNVRDDNVRQRDLRMLKTLLDDHLHELRDGEAEAFASMRFDLTAYGQTSMSTRFEQLTDKQRAWVQAVYDRIVPQYENAWSAGRVPKGIATPESRAFDKMLAGPKVLKPPTRVRRDDDT